MDNSYKNSCSLSYELIITEFLYQQKVDLDLH